MMNNQTVLTYGTRDDVPFLSNRPDNLHCLQAAYGMIRHYFEPAWQIDWAEWSQQTGFVAGKGSWSLAGLAWFKDHQYDVQHITSFDYQRFANEGADYLYESLGQEAGSWEVRNSDLPVEMARSATFAVSGMWQHRRPDFEDIKLYIDRGYLIKCIVNQNELNNLPGFVGHAVVVIGYDADHLIIHDPGLPPLPNRLVTYDTFLKAWTDPNANMEKLDAIKFLGDGQS